MTDRWDRLAALEQAAIEPPWEGVSVDEVYVAQGHPRSRHGIVTANTDTDVFIAEMRNALPDLLRERAELRAALELIAMEGPAALAMLRAHGYVFDQWPVGKDIHPDQWTDVQRWQGCAFSLYTDLVEVSERARAALAGDRTPE